MRGMQCGEDITAGARARNPTCSAWQALASLDANSVNGSRSASTAFRLRSGRFSRLFVASARFYRRTRFLRRDRILRALAHTAMMLTWPRVAR